MEILSEIAALIARHAPGEGVQSTPIERLALVRSSTTTMPMPNVYQPLLCLAVQGVKQVELGDQVFVYTPGRYGIVTHDLPATGRVIEATPEHPYLCFVLHFDSVALGELALRVPPPPGPPPSPPTLGKIVAEPCPELLGPVSRR